MGDSPNTVQLGMFRRTPLTGPRGRWRRWPARPSQRERILSPWRSTPRANSPTWRIKVPTTFRPTPLTRARGRWRRLSTRPLPLDRFLNRWRQPPGRPRPQFL